MFRRLMLWMLLAMLATSVLPAQDDEDEPIPPPRRAGATKIGGAAGFTQGLLYLNIDPINDVMRRQNLAEFSKNGVVMTGGHIYGYTLFVPNFRIGGTWSGGNLKSQTLNGNVVREVKLSVGYGGATFEYVIPVVPRLDLTLGMMLGGGGMDLDFTRSYGLVQSWDTTWSDFGSNLPVNEYSGKLAGSFFLYQPAFTVEYSLLRWLGLRVGATYLGMVGGSWKRDDKYEVFGVPDNVSGKGWLFTSGIYIGTFVF